MIKDDMTKQAVRKNLNLAEGIQKTKRRSKAAGIASIYQQIMVESLADTNWHAHLRCPSNFAELST
jgi:hypothetical protein